MVFFTRTERCYNCGGSGDCPDCDGTGYNATGIDHMVHAFTGDDVPCDNCNETGNCPECGGMGEFEIDDDEE